MAKQKFFVGDRLKTKHGQDFTVIDYNGTKDITIRFDCGYTKSVQGVSIHKGTIEYPFHKTAFGVGYLGVGIHKATKTNKKTNAYSCWYNMMNRCYGNTDNNKSYSDTTVCDEWHNFQNFAEWFNKNYINGFTLDKDLRVKWSSIYSPDTCSFVPNALNILLTDHRAERGILPIGVTRKGSKFSARCFDANGKRKYLGTFEDKVSAFKAYKEFKEKVIKESAVRYKNMVHPDIYKTLMSWVVVPFPEIDRELSK